MSTSQLLHRLNALGDPLSREVAAHIRRMRNAIDDLDNALWKACGDDEQIVRATVVSQGGDYQLIKELTR